ncbi:MAG: copper oxidase [Steroidobacteraceae bacterium]|nr:copper oxidase [Steroidobacteraceae bacterium]MDW8259158.1 copper oxidase [Gammaproteobacteria bacterium]
MSELRRALLNRRRLLAGAGALGAGALWSERSSPQGEQHRATMQRVAREPAATETAAAAPSVDRAAMPARRGRVVTPNGWTLPYRLRDGFKEFHLIAGEIEHEFAPGSKIKAWGYNGTTPGPTIEAYEGDRVRIYVTNKLPEHTSIHWHGILLPAGMDGVGGLTQPHIQPGETFVYEFTLQESGSRMYHPHADEVVQLSMGLMGLFIIHPRGAPAVDRDYAYLLHNWAVHPGTYRPDPSIMTEFDLWTLNGKVFPATEPMVAQVGERVRIRFANLSMHDHPMHLHGHHFRVTGTDAGPIPASAQYQLTTALVPVGGLLDIEFTARDVGDWPLHCHKAHHTMNAMGHGIPNPLGVRQRDLDAEIAKHLPGYFSMGEAGMAEHQMHIEMGHHEGPENTLPMMGGKGPYGNVEMGGMFTVLKVRRTLQAGVDPGWYRPPRELIARKVSDDPDFKP